VIKDESGTPANAIAARFRSLPVPIIGRINQDSLWLDCRALDIDLDEVTALIMNHYPA